MTTTAKTTGRKKQATRTGGSRRATRATRTKARPKVDANPSDMHQAELGTAATHESPPQPRDDSQETVVFAFRLTRAERDLIHEAAGSAKASRFVRTLALAAARGDEAVLQDLLNQTREKAH